MNRRQPSILIVDDEADFRDNLADILALDGYETVPASCVRDVHARGDLHRFTAILLDRRLPDGNGDSLLPYIRENAPDTAVILMTGHAEIDAAIAALRHGAVDFLLKPIEPKILRDRLGRVCAQQRMQWELAEAQSKLIQAERLAAIGETIATLTHEARNVLSALKMGLDMLPMILDEPDAIRTTIGHLKNCELRLRRLFEDVREFAAPIRLERTDFNISDIWRKAWRSLEFKWRDRDVLFDEEIADVPLNYCGDAFRLEQVFRNLFENSLAASSDPVVISISCSQAPGQDDHLCIAVRDNGPGLSSEQLEKVFDAFFTTKTGGTGLGMAISRRIIEAHGGSITAIEDTVQGAEFRIVAPTACSDVTCSA
jgi:signal transduction histidine kinase